MVHELLKWEPKVVDALWIFFLRMFVYSTLRYDMCHYKMEMPSLWWWNVILSWRQRLLCGQIFRVRMVFKLFCFVCVYFRFHSPLNTKSVFLNFICIWDLVLICWKMWSPCSLKTTKIGIRTPLKSANYFRFVSQTTDDEATTFLSRMLNFVKIGQTYYWVYSMHWVDN